MHHTWEVTRIQREMEKPLDRDEKYEKYHVGARSPWLSWAFRSFILPLICLPFHFKWVYRFLAETN